MIDTGVEVEWGGELRRFALPFAQLRALQKEVGRGPSAILKDIGEAAKIANAVIATLRFSLEGAGMEFSEAEKLAEKSVTPFIEAVILSRAILESWSVATGKAVEETSLAKWTRAKPAAEPDKDGKIDFGSYLNMAGAAGIQGVDEMDFPDLLYRLAGYLEANCKEPPPPAPTVAQHEDAKRRWAELQEKNRSE